MNTLPLSSRHCEAMEGRPALARAEIDSHLTQVSGWAVSDGAIEKRFAFDDFHQTMKFVNAVAEMAHVEDHHPELAVSYGHCVVRYNTHAVGGISVNDFICAARLDALPP